VDALQALRYRQGDTDDEHHVEGRQHEDGRGQDRLEQVERIPLVAVLELRDREPGGGEQQQEQENRRPGRDDLHPEAVLGEHPAGDRGGRQERREQQHEHGEGAGQRLPRGPVGGLCHPYSQAPYQADPGRVDP
jgi:hypothetical protein